MAFGLISDSGSAQINGEILGGLVTGTNGEFLALPISSTVLGGLSGLTTNQWSRFYLSDSFGTASGSVIQALNYLSASIKSNADADVEGPSSATDNAVVRFDGTSGKLIQDTSVVTIADDGTVAGGAGGDSYGLSSVGQISGANAVIAGTTVSGAGGISGQTLTLPGATVDIAGKMVVSGVLAGNNNISSSAAIIAGTNVSGAGGVSGQSLAIGGAANLFAVTNAGLVEGGAGGDSYTITAAGAISGASSIIAGTTISGAGAAAAQSLIVANSFKVTSNGSITGSGLATFSNTEVAQGGGYKPALIISSSEISTAENAALIPRFIIQGTNNAGGLADFMISVSGGMFKVQELSNGTWPV